MYTFIVPFVTILLLIARRFINNSDRYSFLYLDTFGYFLQFRGIDQCNQLKFFLVF